MGENVATLKQTRFSIVKKSYEIIMILKIHPKAICYSLPQIVARNRPHQFSQFPFLLIMTRTWSLMKTSRPDADCDLKMFDIVQPMNKTAYWNTTKAACLTDVHRESMSVPMSGKAESGKLSFKRFLFRVGVAVRGEIRFDKINIFILFRRHFNPISSHIF